MAGVDAQRDLRPCLQVARPPRLPQVVDPDRTLVPHEPQRYDVRRSVRRHRPSTHRARFAKELIELLIGQPKLFARNRHQPRYRYSGASTTHTLPPMTATRTGPPCT